MFLSCDANNTLITDPDNNPVVLKSWRYFIVADTMGINKIGEIGHSKNWKLISSPSIVPENYNKKYLWIKTVLPEWKGTTPVVFIGHVYYGLSVYLNNELLYKIGDENSSEIKLIGWNKNIVQMPYFQKGDELILKLQLGKNIHPVDGNIILGPFGKILYNIFLQDVYGLVFAIIFIFLGIMIFTLFFILGRFKLLLGVSLFLFPVGIFIAVNSSFLQAIFIHPLFFYHLDYISFITSVASGFYVIEQILSSKYKRTINVFWKIHIAILILLIIVLALTQITFLDVLPYYVILLTVQLIIAVYLMVLSSRKGSVENKILLVGMLVFSFSAISENILYYYNGMGMNFGYSVKVVHFGVLTFVLSIFWIAYKKYKNSVEQNEILRQNELNVIKRENMTRQRFSDMLLESQENERSRIALELHDSVGQKLLLIKNQLHFEIKKIADGRIRDPLQKITNLTGETIQEVRNITYNLHPQYLDQLGLATAIETIIENISETSPIDLQVNIDKIDDFFSKADEVNFFRIIQESLNNIIKHSKATEAFINIKSEENSVDLEIKDNGIGFSENNSSENGLGITGMKERARILDAEFKMITGEKGTTIKIKCRKKLLTKYEN